MVELVINFLHSSSVVSVVVLGWLAFYMFLTLWVFLYRFMAISSYCRDENLSLRMLVSGEKMYPSSIVLIQGIVGDGINKEIMGIWKHQILQKASRGMTFLAIVASTAPFIGLFGTVIEILEAFFQLGGGGQVSFDTVAPIISKALIATATGILTAIPAYSFHLILKRKMYDLNVVLQMELDFLLSRQDQNQIRF
ncbi:MotA/TolQ/ExbB proton channel family protein [Helicobacter kayseriensis]|uniref:MotA/TolQ/ExbB proton channel family protein n=1 Tax=Helicobacter kayseriensis TaxID=2905877 RepID=UPI001E2A9059|nr:MotA/TolQ/ExbB proton channel family protein [Helicobacter kayseriensis]MCE3046886.1 MotA/TolQ/ExbB proton channel family protein [Helicobacter kayseriensis]MCE3048454.1 MotA/TolQ/ExbB proton channel family protein [Helicobacter kayseriensis]